MNKTDVSGVSVEDIQAIVCIKQALNNPARKNRDVRVNLDKDGKMRIFEVNMTRVN